MSTSQFAPFIRWTDEGQDVILSALHQESPTSKTETETETETELVPMTFGFLSDLHTVKIKEAGNVGRSNWKLLQPLHYNSPSYGLVIVPTGFITDFASVPRLPFAYWLTGDTAHASAVIHDYLCKHDYLEGMISWNEAADVFYEAMGYEGTPGWRRWVMKLGVKLMPQKQLETK